VTSPFVDVIPAVDTVDGQRDAVGVGIAKLPLLAAIVETRLFAAPTVRSTNPLVAFACSETALHAAGRRLRDVVAESSTIDDVLALMNAVTAGTVTGRAVRVATPATHSSPYSLVRAA